MKTYKLLLLKIARVIIYTIITLLAIYAMYGYFLSLVPEGKPLYYYIAFCLFMTAYWALAIFLGLKTVQLIRWINRKIKNY